MRIILFMLFLLLIIASEVVIDMVYFQDYEVSLYERPMENQSEKESNDGLEDEVKLHPYEDNHEGSGSAQTFYQTGNSQLALARMTPFLEVLSPPPE